MVHCALLTLIEIHNEKRAKTTKLNSSGVNQDLQPLGIKRFGSISLQVTHVSQLGEHDFVTCAALPANIKGICMDIAGDTWELLG